MLQSVQEIRKKLRLAMDGANSTSMRNRGVEYKMNFGVPIVTLRKIATQYTPNANLANALWKEDTRELKILATLIQPPESFESADEWVKSIHNLELAEQACMNLFCNMPNAGAIASSWINATDLYIQLCGFLLYTRLFMKDYQLEADTEKYFHAVFNALDNESMLLRNAAVTSLKKLGRQSVVNAKNILARYTSQYPSEDIQKQIIYDDLNFEFDYYS